MRGVWLLMLCLVVAGLSVAPALGQITVGGSSPLTYSQDFNTLPSTLSTTFVQYDQTSPTLPGWFAIRTGTGTTINADNGGTLDGHLYSYGALTNPDRALGSIGSGNATAGHFAWGVVFQNTASETLNVNIQYTGEQWRRGGSGAAQTVVFSYLLAATPPAATSAGIPIPTTGGGIPTGYTNVSGLDFISPQAVGAAAALDGNAAANRILFNQDVSIGLAVNQYVVFHWSDPNHAGNDHGLSIDDMTFTFTPVPEPATVLAVAAVGLGLASAGRRLRRRVA